MFSQCKQKPVVNVLPTPDSSQITAPVSNSVLSKDVSDFASKVISNQNTFAKAEIKFNLKFESPDKNLSISGTLRMVRDSIIWLTVSPGLGIEAARAVFTPDTVICIYRLGSKYFKGNYSIVKRFLPVEVDFHTLQSIFFNDFFVFPSVDLNTIDNYFIKQSSPDYVSIISNETFANDKNIRFTEDFNSQYKVVNANIITKDNTLGLKISYSEFQTFSGYLLPANINLNLQTLSGLSNIYISYTSFNFTKDLTFPCNIPSNYSLILN